MTCDPADFYNERRVKARKPHRCCETGRVIPPGEFYWRVVGKWDGQPRSYAQSEAAYHLARYLNMVVYASDYRHDGCVVPFRGVGEDVADSDDESIKSERDRVKRGEITRDSTNYNPWAHKP